MPRLQRSPSLMAFVAIWSMLFLAVDASVAKVGSDTERRVTHTPLFDTSHLIDGLHTANAGAVVSYLEKVNETYQAVNGINDILAEKVNETYQAVNGINDILAELKLEARSQSATNRVEAVLLSNNDECFRSTLFVMALIFIAFVLGHESSLIALVA